MAQVSDNALTVTPVQARKAILKAFKVKRPIFLRGPAGIGKSDIMEDIAVNELKGAIVDMRLSQCDQTDLRGIPFFNKDTGLMEWAPPVELPSKEFAAQYPYVVLFLDEINSAAPAVQAAAYQLILNRKVGTYTLPDNVVIAAAGNLDTDKGVVYKMPLPLANRFLHLTLRSDFPSWQEWAVNHNVHKDVVGYLSFAKQDMHNYNANSPDLAFATPRTWTFVSDLLHVEDTDNETLFHLIAGAVGQGVATKFMAHRKVASKMPNPSDILSGKVTDLKTEEISAMYSLTISLCYELRDAVDNNKIDAKELEKMADNYLVYMMKNFEHELVVMGARIALKTYSLPIEFSNLPSFDEFFKRFGKHIVAASGAR